MAEIRNQLKSLFFQHHQLSAFQIREHLLKLGTRCSLVTVYAELKKLVVQNVVLKEKQRYVLSISWLLDAQLSLQKVYQRLLASPDFFSIFEQQAEATGKSSWRFTSITQMNEFWVQLILTLIPRVTSQRVLEYVPRLWFPYIGTDQDARYQRMFIANKTDISVAIGGNSFLDRAPSRDRAVPLSYSCFPAPTSLRQKRNRCFCIIDDWLITVSFPVNFAKELDSLFEKSCSERSNAASVAVILSRRIRVGLSVEKATRAQKSIRLLLEKACR